MPEEGPAIIPTSRILIVLVHGTWGRGFFGSPTSTRKSNRSRWFESGSKFRDQLKRLLTSEQLHPSFLEFAWSGKNTVIDRYRASLGLKVELSRLAASFPSARLVVIAHSHGGNVALDALRYLPSSVTSSLLFISLATPFVEIKWIPDDRVLSAAFRQNITNLFIAFALVLIGLLIIPGNWYLLVVGLAGLFAFLAWSVGRGTVDLVTPVANSRSPFLRGLILRAAGDEAQLALVVGSIAAKLGSILTKGGHFLKRASWLLLPVIVLCQLFGLGHLSDIVARFIVASFALGVAVIFPAVLIIGLGRCVAGWDLLRGGADSEIKLQQVPNPDHDIDLVTIQSSSRMFFGLIHSIYENPQCAPTVANWIIEIQRTRRGRPRGVPARYWSI